MKPDVAHTLASLLFTYLMFGKKSQRYGVKSDSEQNPTFILLQRKTTHHIIHFKAEALVNITNIPVLKIQRKNLCNI